MMVIERQKQAAWSYTAVGSLRMEMLQHRKSKEEDQEKERIEWTSSLAVQQAIKKHEDSITCITAETEHHTV